MRLAAIYNAWDGVELLKYSIESVYRHVDVIVIVYQDVSNYGEKYDPMHEFEEIINIFPEYNFVFYKYAPKTSLKGMGNEIIKRNIGLKIALENNCTHFLHMDCDELYEDFGKAKELYLKSGKEGSVCKLYTYFKRPELRFETEDGYFVPFIHKLNHDTKAGLQRQFPFYADPTRQINCKDVAQLVVHMHHFSWVRRDIEMKCRNSSAKKNIQAGTMLEDYYNPEVSEGFKVRDYDKKLINVGNPFGISI